MKINRIDKPTDELIEENNIREIVDEYKEIAEDKTPVEAFVYGFVYAKMLFEADATLTKY